MTDHVDSNVSAAQLDRVEQLRARRGNGARPAIPRAEATAVTASTAPAPTTSTRRRRRHVAQSSRIVAAGLGAMTMFGIVAALGMNAPFAATGTTPAGTAPAGTAPAGTAPAGTATIPVAIPAAAPIQVVVHRIPVAATTPAADANGRQLVEVPGLSPVGDAPAPIVLTANPVVKTVTIAAPAAAAAPAAPSAPAPSATTRGST